MFIVSGDGPRCGSSAMMYALGEGGIPVAHHKAADAWASAQADGGYHPSPGGRFELATEYINPKGFPQPIYKGMAIKCLPWPWTPFMEHAITAYCWGYTASDRVDWDLEKTRIVWIRRPAEDRWASFEKAHSVGFTDLVHGPYAKEAMVWRDACADVIRITLEWNLKPPVFTQIEFDDLINQPESVFNLLKERGWPLDPEPAAAAIRSGKTKA